MANLKGNTGVALTLRTLETMLEEARGTVRAIETTINFMRSTRGEQVQRRTESVIDQALKLERERTEGSTEAATTDGAKGGYAKANGNHTKAAVAERRAHTAAFLAKLDRNKPTPIVGAASSIGIAIGPLIHHGYMKKKGDGYVRTAKEFTVAPPWIPAPNNSSNGDHANT